MQFSVLWSGYVKDFKYAQIPPVPRLCKCGTVLPARRHVCDTCKKQKQKRAWVRRSRAQAQAAAHGR